MREFFGVANAAALGTFGNLELGAIGALLGYIRLTQMGRMPKLERPRKDSGSDFLQIDAFSARNLEIFESLNAEAGGLSLFGVMDRTKTPMGKRMLKSWLGSPLTDAAKINARLDAVEFFAGDAALADGVRERLSRAFDVERIMGRVGLGRAGPRDLRNLAATFAIAPELNAMLDGASSPMAPALARLNPMRELARGIEDAISDDPPASASSGGFIKAGFDPALDEYRRLSEDSKGVIAELQAKYSLDTSIASLKIKYNTLSGYFIEVPAAKATPMMDTKSGFRHRQTLVGAVRFTTPELEEIEYKILAANEKYAALEAEIFHRLAADVAANAEPIAAFASSLAELDAFASLASLAESEGYCRPAIDGSLAFEVEDGRHPVVEHAMKKSGGAFVPNDARFGEGEGESRLWLLTGPNMAGKSTFLRQNAIIVVMAQAGSFVPAVRARIGIVDRLFSRVGASDNLAQGLSTFMVEMSETAAILNAATERSFVILDEIGRGTATFDGLSIAWAVLEYLGRVARCRCLFATHYHELGAALPKLANASAHTMEVKEYEGDIIFMHKVAPGMARSSYGIHVARLAGIPEPVSRRASEILAALESDEAVGKAKGRVGRIAETDLFTYRDAPTRDAAGEARKLEKLAAKIREIDPDSLSPKDALEILYEIKDMA
jgi:DNA mismatch repair protein MutS